MTINAILIFLFLIINNNTLSMKQNRIRKIACDNKIYNNNCKKYMIDIDGTVCYTKNSDYLNSVPFQYNIDIFNKLYDDGNQVHYWTARGANSGKNWDSLTIEQFKKWNIKYTSINMDKPHYDFWIDDKAINANNVDILKKI